MKSQVKANGILLIYNHPLGKSAPTILEHVNAFRKNSQFKVWNINTELGFHRGLSELNFEIIMLHYSLFGSWPFSLNKDYIEYLGRAKSYKIAFFQDEHQNCLARFKLIDMLRVDCIYSLLEPENFSKVYQKRTKVSEVIYTLTGYVSDELIDKAEELTRPDHERSIDVGYRARPLSFDMGKGAREKTAIADEFVKLAAPIDLAVDIKTNAADRIYGDAWYEFVANCRAMLGVEAGVSVFDIEGKVHAACARLLREKPRLSFEDVYATVLRPWENNIYYRTISPRIFEAAALRVCMILFEGRYSGILRPMVHYIPLKKDFSNFDEVIARFNSAEVRKRITESAYEDLIASGKYSYAGFIRQYDEYLMRLGYTPNRDARTVSTVAAKLRKGEWARRIIAQFRMASRRPFPGKSLVKALVKPTLGYFKKKSEYNSIKWYEHDESNHKSST